MGSRSRVTSPSRSPRTARRSPSRARSRTARAIPSRSYVSRNVSAAGSSTARGSYRAQMSRTSSSTALTARLAQRCTMTCRHADGELHRAPRRSPFRRALRHELLRRAPKGGWPLVMSTGAGHGPTSLPEGEVISGAPGRMPASRVVMIANQAKQVHELLELEGLVRDHSSPERASPSRGGTIDRFGGRVRRSRERSSHRFVHAISRCLSRRCPARAAVDQRR